MPRIAVTTPTGNVGSRVVRLLVQAGEHPVLLLRDATKLDPQLGRYCSVHEVDQGNADEVIAATAGVTALYWVNPPTPDEDPVAGHLRMGESAAAAVRENGIPRVVFQSSVGAEARTGFGDIDGLGRTEELLDATDADVTHLRCGYFFTNLLLDLDSVRAGRISSTLPVEHRMPWVAPRDIGDVAAARLLAPHWIGRHALGVHGPQDLSLTEVAQILTTALGRDISAEQVSEETVAAGLREMGMTGEQVEAVLGMSRGQRGFTPENPRELITTTPTTLGAWAHVVLRPLLSPPDS